MSDPVARARFMAELVCEDLLAGRTDRPGARRALDAHLRRIDPAMTPAASQALLRGAWRAVTKAKRLDDARRWLRTAEQAIARADAAILDELRASVRAAIADAVAARLRAAEILAAARGALEATMADELRLRAVARAAACPPQVQGRDNVAALHDAADTVVGVWAVQDLAARARAELDAWLQAEVEDAILVELARRPLPAHRIATIRARQEALGDRRRA